ncbi:hypothetical protein [Sphingomonas sp. Leaf231]|uniref:hypothetical protein n=1 Tax=Sphingomonas sp. Leaf231 TaxID=1736301 RepID=UPI000A7CF096|nr:hypothetical protein [Sphingomonas sp. Leaf231]
MSGTMSAAMTVEGGAFIDPGCTMVEPQGLVPRRSAFVGAQAFVEATGGVEIGVAGRCIPE